jgi:hypothetical protein
MPEQVAEGLKWRVCLGFGANGVWALMIFRPVIIEGFRGLIFVRGTKTAVGSAESFI